MGGHSTCIGTTIGVVKYERRTTYDEFNFIVTVHVTSYLRKTDKFCGNPLRLSVKTCAEISGTYSASLRIVCSESAEHLC